MGHAPPDIDAHATRFAGIKWQRSAQAHVMAAENK
jgi:hypothetical protein